MFAVCLENDDAEAVYVDSVAGMNGAARRGADGFDVCGVVVTRDVGVFAVFAVIEEFADFYVLDEVRHAPYMIRVEVGDEHLVDLRDPCILHRRLNALGIAAFISRPPGVDQEGSPRRGDQQCGLSALDIDGIDPQVFP